MMDIVLTEQTGKILREQLLDGDSEACAVLVASSSSGGDEGSHSDERLLVRQAIVASPADYVRRSAVEAVLTPDFVARVTKQAKLSDASLVFVHSHPGNTPPRFSAIDDLGEARLAKFVAGRIPGRRHAAIVISRGGFQARLLGTGMEVRVVEVGTHRRVLCGLSSDSPRTAAAFDRQVRAFGAQGQLELQALKVAIVGLGGTGSLAAQQLAHLGVSRFVLVDPDVIEATNLNRVAGANDGDIGTAKVEVAARTIGAIARGAKIEVVQGDITRERFARKLLTADVILGCTDSHGSRAVLQQVAYQHLIPCIDMGSTIASKGSQISHIVGRVQALAPGQACLACSGLLNSSAVRKDMMSEFERRADPYFEGAAEPAPAVISLNGTVVSLAITMLLSMTTGIPSSARHLLYNAMTSTLRSVRATAQDDCYICSEAGGLARGDDWPLNVRRD